MKLDKRYELNGDRWESYYIIECDMCHEVGNDSWPWYTRFEKHYCPECAFRIGLISSAYYLKNYGHMAKRVGINPHTGEIELTNKKRFSWEALDSDYRRDIRYKKWRISVFERDEYKCQHCGQVGGQLEAHHIKPFRQWESLRFEITNGITLCRTCHLELHSRERKKNE